MTQEANTAKAPSGSAAPFAEANAAKAPAGSAAPFAEANTAKVPSGSAAPFALVELFTSEGCSSCPPADDLLRQMAEDARAANRPVFFLSFHVDYWNDLGWSDPFSAEAFSDRQRAYASATGATGVYTPQMIVGGRDAFVGSDSARAHRSVEQALTEVASTPISLKAHAPPGADHADVTYAVTSPPPGTILHVALIEKDLTVRVQRGENAGRTLHHANVVRAFKSVRLDDAPQGALTIPLPFPLPSPVDRAKVSLIGYAQRSETLAVIGATGAPLEESRPPTARTTAILNP